MDAILYSILIPNLLFVVSVVILVCWSDYHIFYCLALHREKKSLTFLAFSSAGQIITVLTALFCIGKFFLKIYCHSYLLVRDDHIFYCFALPQREEYTKDFFFQIFCNNSSNCYIISNQDCIKSNEFHDTANS